MAKICVDTLAGVKYPEVIAKLPKKYGTGYFWDEFGLAKQQIAEDASSGRSYIRVQGIWAKHEFNSSHENKAVKIGKELNAIAARNPNCLIHYSPYCEHKKPASYMAPFLNKVKLHCPKLEIINNPVSGGQWVEGFINELHHNDKPAGMPKGKFIFSMDGLHQPDCDITKYYQYLDNPNCIAFFAWCLQDNCKRNAKDTTPAKLRQCKPTPELHHSLIFQLENRKLPVSLEAGFIYKTHSEQHKDIDPRANKIVVIGPKGKRYKSMTVGNVALSDGGFTEDNRQTWRSNKWAYKQGRKADLKANGKKVGTIDFPFRQNEWREKT